MGRFKKEHQLVDIGIPMFLPIVVRKTVITDTETRRSAKGVDRNSHEASDRKAWKQLSAESMDE